MSVQKLDWVDGSTLTVNYCYILCRNSYTGAGSAEQSVLPIRQLYQTMADSLSECRNWAFLGHCTILVRHSWAFCSLRETTHFGQHAVTVELRILGYHNIIWTSQAWILQFRLNFTFLNIATSHDLHILRYHITSWTSHSWILQHQLNFRFLLIIIQLA